MSWDINRVIVVGRLASDVELRYTPGNVAVARFRIAVGGKQKADGTDNVSFFNVVVWNKQAELCSKFLSKGKQIAIDGRLEQRSWEAQDGTKRNVVEIVAERIEFLGSAASSRIEDTGKISGGESLKSEYSFDSDFYDNTDFDPTPVEPFDSYEGKDNKLDVDF